MRACLFILAVVAVFGELAYTIWLESAVIAEAYEIRRLRDETSTLDNQIRIVEADLAKSSRLKILTMKAKQMGLDDLVMGAASPLEDIPKRQNSAFDDAD